MSILQILLGLSTLVVLCLWAYGCYQRRLVWDVTPKVRFKRAYGTAPSKTAVLVLTGAFNGPPHTERIIKNFWQTVGDVYVIDYPLRRFDRHHTMLAAYKCVDGKRQYKKVVVVGYSLGGLIALLLAKFANRRNHVLAKKLVLVLADTPLYLRHLRVPGGAAVPAKLTWLAGLVVPVLWLASRSGPLFNRLSSLVAKATFIPAPDEMRESGMDKGQFGRHMAFLLRNQLSLVCEQILAIAATRTFKQSDFNEGMQVVYLQCGDGSQRDMLLKNGKLRNNPDAPDKVILGDAAVASLRELFPNMRHIYVGKGTMHVALVEGWRSWEDTSRRAVKLIA